MPNFFNKLGSFTVVGTSLQDGFFAFTSDANLDHILPDATLRTLNWATGIKNSNGSSYVVNMTNVQVSTDLLQGGDKSDVLYGSNLSDAVFYNNGTFGSGVGGFDSIEQFFLGGGNDFLDLTGHGVGGVDYAKDVVVNGGAGDDIIIGGAGKDTIDGDAGNDTIFGYRGSDTIRGGAGNDTLYGDDLGFNGISGDDLLQGGAGNDTLYGGAGTDRLEGGDDNDVLYGGRGGDNLFGEAGDDTLYGDDAGTNGNDKLDGGSGNDTIFAGGGDDEGSGGIGNDIINGEAGNDFLRGDAGDDLLDGGAGNDTINGGVGTDTLKGQAGTDRLIGGTGKDTMTGGTEADTFVFNVGDTSLNSSTYDRITDFKTGVDSVDLSFVAGPLASSAYAEGTISTNVYATALAAANSLMSSGTTAVFVAGTVDGWLFWDSNNDSILDQAALMQGLNATAKFDYLDIT